MPKVARLKARIEPDKEDAVLARVDDHLQLALQCRQFTRQQPAFVHRFLPAGRIGAHGLQRAGEAARMADVVSDEIEAALHEGTYWRRRAAMPGRQACRYGDQSFSAARNLPVFPEADKFEAGGLEASGRFQHVPLGGRRQADDAPPLKLPDKRMGQREFALHHGVRGAWQLRG